MVQEPYRKIDTRGYIPQACSDKIAKITNMAIDLEQLKKDGVYQVKASLGAISADMEQIAGAIAAAAATRRKLNRWATLCIIGGILLVVLNGVLGVIAAIVGGIAIVTAIVLFVSAAKAGGDMLKHRDRHGLLSDLLKIFQHDSEAKSHFSIRLALKSVPELLRDEPFPQRKKGKQLFYREQFLSVEGELMDGTVVSEEIVELCRKRTYVNPRGKSKSKTRMRYLVTMRFDYPTDIYGDAQPAQKALNETFRVSPATMIREVRVSEKAILVKALVNSENEIVQSSAMLSLGAYRILNLARRAASSGAQGGKA